jgi:acetyl esterase/lipase
VALRIAVVDGPGIARDEGWLRAACAEWARELGVEAALTVASDERTLADAVRHARSRADALVIGPGESENSAVVAEAVTAAGVPSVAVDLHAVRAAHTRVALAASYAIRGRGIDGYRWALRHLVWAAALPFETHAYGPLDDQVGDLRLPDAPPPHPVVALLHGGGWKEHWTRDLMDGAAVDLTRRGYATWNLEYRRVGPGGGGWPTTFLDVAAGLDALVELSGRHQLDLDRVTVLGHSAGGQLALWSASRSTGDPGGAARVRPALVVAIAAVADLVEASRRGLVGGDDIAARLLGGTPETVPDRYALASPLERLPLGVPQLVVQGSRDYLTDLRDLARRYVDRATRAGDPVELLELDAAEHLEVVDASTAAWTAIAERIDERVGTAGDRAMLRAQ